MKTPTHEQAFQVLLLQAADERRGDVLLGDSLSRAREAVLPFLVGAEFPSVYLEFPLIGEPFLDVTMLYNELEVGTRIASEAVADTEAILDWYAGIRQSGLADIADGDKAGTDASEDGPREAAHPYADVSFGFELDTKNPEPSRAAVHFQPRRHKELVEPFCATLGEGRRGQLYLDFAARAPEGWKPSFFGFFRGRPGSPMRVCGYLGSEEAHACAHSPDHLAEVFEAVGFGAYDDQMLSQACALMATSPEGLDYQFDIYDDGYLGPTFAIDLQFGIARPKEVEASFENGLAARVLGLLERQGVADERWHLVGQAAFARSVDVALADGSTGRYAFTLMPQWAKARWHEGSQQPSKLYHFAHAGLVG